MCALSRHPLPPNSITDLVFDLNHLSPRFRMPAVCFPLCASVCVCVGGVLGGVGSIYHWLLSRSDTIPPSSKYTHTPSLPSLPNRSPPPVTQSPPSRTHEHSQKQHRWGMIWLKWFSDWGDFTAETLCFGPPNHHHHHHQRSRRVAAAAAGRWQVDQSRAKLLLCDCFVNVSTFCLTDIQLQCAFETFFSLMIALVGARRDIDRGRTVHSLIFHSWSLLNLALTNSFLYRFYID